MSVWRHARAVTLLPGMVTVVVPVLIVIIGDGLSVGWGLDGIMAALPVLIGLVLIASGLALWVWTLRLFARIGEGTLAPWDPTRQLVTQGPYSRVRNPMITAVLAVLLGEAALSGSLGVLTWYVAFFTVNWLSFVFHEEPDLELRFGDEYRAYRQSVPRWIPRCTRSRPPGGAPRHP